LDSPLNNNAPTLLIVIPARVRGSRNRRNEKNRPPPSNRIFSSHRFWIPAFAGMTKGRGASFLDSRFRGNDEGAGRIVSGFPLSRE
jgi:hypothetical protein